MVWNVIEKGSDIPFAMQGFSMQVHDSDVTEKN